jgi:hypothetical protein
MKIAITLILAMFLVHPDAENLGSLVYNDLTIQIDEIEAEAVLETLAQELNVLMTVYWAKDAGDGCEREKKVSLQLRNQPAVVVLNRIVQQLGSEEHEAAWQLRDGVIEIGLKNKLSQKQFQRIETYPIIDLVFNLKNFSTTSQRNGTGGIESAVQKQQRIDAVIEKITKFVEPEVWEQNGGPCTITNYNETLIVQAPNFVHRQLGGYSFAPTKPEGMPTRSVQFNGDRTSVTTYNN